MSSTLSVVAVAPEVQDLPKLAVWDELGQIGDIDNVKLNIIPAPTRQRIVDWLRRSDCDVFLWVGHGTPARLIMQGDAVDPHWLATQLSTCKVCTAIIATCGSGLRPDSQHFSQGFADVLPAAGIDTITMVLPEVTDKAAIHYDVALIQALSSGVALRQAHNVGIAAAAEYGGVQAAQLTPADGTAKQRRMNGNPVAPNEAALRSLGDKMDKIGDQVHALDVRQERLEIKVEQIGKDQEQQRKDIVDIRQSIQQLRADIHIPPVPRSWLMVVSAFLLIMLVFLVAIMVRLML